MKLIKHDFIKQFFSFFQNAVDKGLKASEWVAAVSPLMGGKGGGKAESAQASGANYEVLNAALDKAVAFASSKLSVSSSEGKA